MVSRYPLISCRASVYTPWAVTNDWSEEPGGYRQRTDPLGIIDGIRISSPRRATVIAWRQGATAPLAARVHGTDGKATSKKEAYSGMRGKGRGRGERGMPTAPCCRVESDEQYCPWPTPYRLLRRMFWGRRAQAKTTPASARLSSEAKTSPRSFMALHLPPVVYGIRDGVATVNLSSFPPIEAVRLRI